MERLRRALLKDSHHDDLYRDWHRQLGFKSVVYFLDNEDHHHDDQGDDHVTDVGGGDLVEDDLQGLRRRQDGQSGRRSVDHPGVATPQLKTWFLWRSRPGPFSTFRLYSRIRWTAVH